MLIRTMLSVFAMVCTVSALAQPMEFGGGADKTNVIDASTLLAKADQYHQTQVTVKGVVTKVCKKRGCWMTLDVEKGEQITVKVRDGDMVFPMSAVGKTALATGQFEVFELSLEKSRRYLAHKAEENGEAFDPGTLENPITIYRLKPSAVTIL
ncbi:DUF4920 domain-containing protein [Pseudoalteromonas sp. OOF1S-7]|uniref:DUF4920 domain-containing protein n=1 Tax=Pseudoalteromonas sp. OOF1S-7 TaxID=2917757 RepID=UPI001EF5761E|nr:DUF4920 domain-containing protein [Pseudoalteromonas sp. OOF1S-7]MCG7534224.1 DUF4920 domain-containing protein [Pseudoalteromonas sp. OOF1S-7]